MLDQCNMNFGPLSQGKSQVINGHIKSLLVLPDKRTSDFWVAPNKCTTFIFKRDKERGRRWKLHRVLAHAFLCGQLGGDMRMGLVPLSSQLGFSFWRGKWWLHSMAFDCFCTFLASKFQLKKRRPLLWVSKWNTLITLECLALLQTC